MTCRSSCRVYGAINRISTVISNSVAFADGYFIPDAIKPGEQIVTKGAQMLLSEELRGQIPSLDEDEG